MTSFHQDKPLLMLPWKYHSLVIASMMLMAMIMLQNVMMVMLRGNQILFNLGKKYLLGSGDMFVFTPGGRGHGMEEE